MTMTDVPLLAPSALAPRRALLRGFGGGSLSPGPWYASAGCLEWINVQWVAKYKGVPFAVQTDERTGGRRVHVHEFPGRENWINEDLGRLRQMVDVEAYVFGDRSDLWAEILFAACSDGGPSLLYLPMRVPLPARCILVSSRFNDQQLGRIDFSMRFVLEPVKADLGQVPSALAYKSGIFLAEYVANNARNVADQARYDFETQFTGDQPAMAREQAANMIRIAAARVRSAYKQARTELLQSSHIDFIIRQINNQADALSASQRTSPDTLTPTVLVRTQRIGRASHLQAVKAGLKIPPNPLSGLALRASTNQVIDAIGNPDEGFGGLLSSALNLLAKGTPDPTDLVQALNTLTTLTTNVLKTQDQTSTAASIRDELQLSATVANFVRRLGISKQCTATIRVAPEDQIGALATRKRLLASINSEIAATTDSRAVNEQLSKLRSAVVDFISYWSPNGLGTKQIDAHTVRPIAITVANVYPRNKVEDRDRQVMKMNKIRHPLFAPADLTILSD